MKSWIWKWFDFLREMKFRRVASELTLEIRNWSPINPRTSGTWAQIDPPLFFNCFQSGQPLSSHRSQSYGKPPQNDTPNNHKLIRWIFTKILNSLSPVAGLTIPCPVPPSSGSVTEKRWIYFCCFNSKAWENIKQYMFSWPIMYLETTAEKCPTIFCCFHVGSL